MLSKNYNKNYEPFPNKDWRNFLSEICKKVDKNQLGLQVISPFGFEVFEDKNFLCKSIKRLYCYIGVPSQTVSTCHPFEISKSFSEQLMLSINEIGIHSSDVVMLAIQDKFLLLREKNYRCSNTDKLIDIQTRIVSDDILHDYANYIICTIDSICSKKEEPEHFIENKRHRSRTYQLYVMLEQIFGYLLPKMNSSERSSFSNLFNFIDNSLQMFYADSELFIPASNVEINLLNSLITPRVQLIKKSLQGNSGELIRLQCDAYHVEGKLELMINKNIYDNAVVKIKSTYLNHV